LADASIRAKRGSQGNRLALYCHLGIVGLYAHDVLGKRCLGGLPTFGKCCGDLILLVRLHWAGLPGVQRNNPLVVERRSTASELECREALTVAPVLCLSLINDRYGA
jgi:hypothetical protein